MIEDEEDIQVIGQYLMAEARTFLSRFAVLPSDAVLDMAVLWATHTWIYRAWDYTPRLDITSVQPGSGKTQVMRLLGLLCARPVQMAQITGPAVWHLIAEREPSPIMLDEADAIFGRGGQRADLLRSILNAGYASDGNIQRVVSGHLADFPVFAPAMFAGLGDLPETLKDRSIVVKMERRKSGQKMERYTAKLHQDIGRKTGKLIGSWAEHIQATASTVIWEDPPAGMPDRQVDIWEPLVGIADCLGGDWPVRVREAARIIATGSAPSGALPPSLALLSGIRDVWPEGADKMPTADLLRGLAAHPLGEWDWPAARAAKELAARLRDQGVTPVPVRLGDKVLQGYRREDLETAWAKLPATTENRPSTCDVVP